MKNKSNYSMYVPSGFTSLNDYDSYVQKIQNFEAIRDLFWVYHDLLYNIMFGLVENTSGKTVDVLIQELHDQFMSRFRKLSTETIIKDFSSDKSSVVLYKNKEGRLSWVGSHTNKFEDREKEVLTEKAHKDFVNKIESGDIAYPELWIWHEKDWKVGNANWLAYDDRGFLLSGGVIDQDKEDLVIALFENTSQMGMSHGMPPESVKYDEDGDIIEYVSKEISLLPIEYACNLLTTFAV
jgi:hypothetical protein